MALPQSLKRVTSALPYALKQDIEGYVRSLDAVQGSIYADAEVSPEQVPRDEFLFFAGVWRLWGQVDGQRWIVQSSLDAAAGFGASGISAGGFSYSRGSDDVQEVRDLRSKYWRWLNRQGCEFLTGVGTPRDLLWALRERRHAG